MRYQKKQKRASFPLIYRGIFVLVIFMFAIILIFPKEEEKKASSVAIKTEVLTDEDLKISLYTESGILTLPLEEYVIHVVAAEMPASYEIEALKSQAVAARTYTIKKIQSGGCNKSSDADICAFSNHCQAYASDETLHERWKDSFEKYDKKIKEAVLSTAGEIITYNGDAIEAFYHASSGGKTEDIANVYSESRAYLKSVDSPDADGYEKTLSFSRERLKEKLNGSEVTLSGRPLSEQFEIISRYESGRVKAIRIGNTTITGIAFRRMLGLDSANFYITPKKDMLLIKTVGFGHGVGMSQSGANAYAKKEFTYQEILKHYYTDVEIEPYSS